MSASGDRANQRRLIIHCGVQKTASTAFHHFVQRNRVPLEPHLELFTPKKRTLTRELGRVSALFSLDGSHEERLVSLIQEMRDTLIPRNVPCLLSHENIPGAMLGRSGVTTLYPKIGAILALMDSHFAPLVPEYVFYTRDMTAWKRSVYNQAVKSDGYLKPKSEFMAETAKCGSWQDLQNRVEREVGADRVKFFAIEDEVTPLRPGRQLLRFANVPESVLDSLEPMSGRSNESLNSGALEFMRQLNGLQLPDAARRPVAQLILRNRNLFVLDEGAA